MFKPGLVHTKYILDLKTSRATYTIEYSRATIEEYIEYSISMENKFIWLYKFILSHITHTKKKHFWYRATFSKHEFLSLDASDIETILSKIQETRFFVPVMRVQADDGFNPSFESNLAFLSQKLCVPPHILIREYTLEQAILLSRGIEYNANMATPEGRAKNRFLDAWDDWGNSEESDLDVVRKMREKKAAKASKK